MRWTHKNWAKKIAWMRERVHERPGAGALDAAGGQVQEGEADVEAQVDDDEHGDGEGPGHQQKRVVQVAEGGAAGADDQHLVFRAGGAFFADLGHAVLAADDKGRETHRAETMAATLTKMPKT